MFKVGDKVVWFNRELLKLIPGKVKYMATGGAYPVIIRTIGEERTFTSDGRSYEESLVPTLFHKGTTLTLDIAPEPERLPDLKVDDLVWVWSEDKENKLIRCFSHFTESHLFAFDYGNTSSRGGKTTWWENYEVYEND